MAPSASKEKRLAKKAAEGKLKGKKGKKTDEVELDANGNPIQDTDSPATSGEKMDEVKRLADQMDKHGISDRVTTGVLSSTQASKSVKITSTSLVFHGRVLITDSTLELTYGRRYGLLGENGCGKSTLLKAIAAREFPIPEHIDIYLLNEGAPPSDLGALEWVVTEAENELERLDKLAEQLLEDEGPESPLLVDLYDVRNTRTTLCSQEHITNLLSAHGQDGSFHLCHSRLADSHWSGFQQEDHSQENQGHVWWLENACRPCQGPVRQALTSASR